MQIKKLIYECGSFKFFFLYSVNAFIIIMMVLILMIFGHDNHGDFFFLYGNF